MALYVVVMLGFSTIYQATVRLALWRHGVESLEIERLDVLDQVKATGEAQLGGRRRPRRRPQCGRNLK